MDRFERVLLIFLAACGILLGLGALGIVPMAVVGKVASASMLLLWLALMSRRALFTRMEKGRPAATVFRGDMNGEWLPLLHPQGPGIWIAALSDAEKLEFLAHIGQSDPQEQARAWADIVVGWKGHCPGGVDGWKGRTCGSRDELPYSGDAVYVCCMKHPDLFTLYAKRLQKSIR